MATKMDQLEDKMAAESKQQSHDLKGIKELLKEFNNRIGKLEGERSQHSVPEGLKENAIEKPSDEVKNQDSHQVYERKPSAILKEPPQFIDKNSELNAKRLDDLESQIRALKDRMPVL